jgi:hypothetical protein
MQIGQTVTWAASGKQMKGLFMQVNNNIAEVICFQMGNLNCHLRVFVSIDLLTLDI